MTRDIMGNITVMLGYYNGHCTVNSYGKIGMLLIYPQLPPFAHYVSIQLLFFEGAILFGGWSTLSRRQKIQSNVVNCMLTVWLNNLLTKFNLQLVIEVIMTVATNIIKQKQHQRQDASQHVFEMYLRNQKKKLWSKMNIRT